MREFPAPVLPPMIRPVASLLAALALTACGAVRAADVIVEPAVDPPELELAAPGARFLLLVNGRTASGREVDLTRGAAYRSTDPAVASVSRGGVVQARGDGRAVIEVQAAGRQLRVPVTVRNSAAPRQFNFENNVVPILSRFGCNSSVCHGKAEGQNGFKLSVFGFDPQADYDALTKEGRGRRVFPGAARRSLLLAKASGAVPHGGGARIAAGSRAYKTLHDWIAAGAPFGSADDPRVVSVRVTPRQRVMAIRSASADDDAEAGVESPGTRQQLRVVATCSDGTRRDVTALARFQSNNDGLASVDERGLVAAGTAPGQVAVMASYMGAVDVFQALIPRAEPVEFPDLPEANFIDGLVNRQLQKLGIVPSETCSDADFLRRVCLDIIGTLPTAAEARAFLTDDHPRKRERLVEALLARPEYADHWALVWSDLLRVDRDTLGHKGAYAYYSWIRQSFAANKPWDRIARELLTAEGPLSESPQGNFYQVTKAPGEMASTFSQVFLGVRIACAQCHHHPFDRWSQQDYYGMLGMFAQVARKTLAGQTALVAQGNPQTKHPRSGATVIAHPLGAAMPEEVPEEFVAGADRRRALADWVTDPDNPWFARNLANRLWARLLGRGLVEPVDDFRATNPPSNPELLDALAAHFVESGYDQQALIRAITASRAYQRSTHPNETNGRDAQNYSRAALKRIDAEVLFDAVCQATGTEEKFKGLPAGYRAIQLWDNRTPHFFLKLFGRPTRETACECERNAEASIAQVLHMMNAPQIQAKVSHASGTIARLVAQHEDNAALVEELYLTFFSRFPSDKEREVALDYLQSAPGGRRQGAEDLAWSMLNSLEFVFNH